MIEATKPRSTRLSRLGALILAASVLAVALAAAPGTVSAAVDFKSGKYSGKTRQITVTGGFRKVEFRLSKKGRVTLTGEPAVAKGLCLSAPEFTLEGRPTTKLSKRGRFTFTKTFVGSKFHRISGRFVSPTEVEGFVVYHFQAQDLCAGGKTKVRFSAKHA